MDRLIGLVLLRFKTDLRALLVARGRALGALLMLPFGLLFSLLGAAAVFFGVRALAAGAPDTLAPLLSLVVTGIGFFWALSPLLAGLALTEGHDLSRLMHFPIPLPVLVLSSLVSNLVQPVALAELPLVAALALALTERPTLLPLTLAGGLLSLAFIVAFAQTVGFALHGLSRNRRLSDLALSLGLALGLLLSLAPFVLLAGGGRSLALLRALLQSDVGLLSPFGWGVRAAVHAGRGEFEPFLGFAVASLGATGAAVGVSALLVQRIYRGELDVGRARSRVARRGGLPLPGIIGALVEKDLRVMWRDPALKTFLLMGLVGPLVFLFFLTGMRGARAPAGSALLLASFVGLSGLGGNVFGLERRGIALLLGFPVPRWRLLVGKNLATLVLRLPGLATVVLAGLLLAPPSLLPAALTIVLATMLIAAGIDNYQSILFPVTVPAPGGNPYGGPAAGGRGLMAVMLNAVLLFGVLLVSAPFVFLAWLPLLLQARWLWLVSLPLGLAGALAVYAMLIGGAASLMSKREPDMLARILGEA